MNEAAEATGPYLDQYPSAWLAASITQAPGAANRDELIKSPQTLLGKRRFSISPRTLSFLFLPLTLFAAFGIGGSVYQMIDEQSVGLTDAITLAFAFFVAYGLYSQLRAILFLTSWGRRLPLIRVQELIEAPRHAPLLGQSDSLTVDESAYMTTRRTAVAVRSHRVAQRLLPFVVLITGAGGVAVLCFFVIYGILEGGDDVALMIGGCFTALATFGYMQFVRALARAGWRGTPMSLARRAFYDSNRLYSGAHSLVQIGVTSAATAVVVTAGVGPIAFPATPHFTLLGFDPSSVRVYQIEPDNGILTVLNNDPNANTQGFSAMGAVSKQFTLPSGEKITTTAAFTIVTTRTGQYLVALQVNRTEQQVITRLQGRVDPAGIAVANGIVVILNHDGTLQQIDTSTGSLVPRGSIGRHVEAAGFTHLTNQFVAIDGTDIFAVNVVKATTSPIARLPDLANLDVCGVTGTLRYLIVADRKSSSLLAFNRDYELAGTIGPSPLEATVCGIVAAAR